MCVYSLARYCIYGHMLLGMEKDTSGTDTSGFQSFSSSFERTGFRDMDACRADTASLVL